MAAEHGLRDELVTALCVNDEHYDPAERALCEPRTGPDYGSRLSAGTLVHPTRESADYALGLLDSGQAWRIERAVRVLWRLVEEQDTDPASETNGLWPWYYEEPLDRMPSPDFNWADFIGVRLAQVLARHQDVLAGQDAALAAAVRRALRLAGRSIMRRDVTLSYTNIAVMGCYVTVVAGQVLADDELAGYGRSRLRRFAAFTEEFGGFAEYNSPVYTGVAITELTRMLRDFTSAADCDLVRQLLARAWREVAPRYHRPSGQWAGPHLRCAATLLTPGRHELDLVRRGLAGRVPLMWGGTPIDPTPHLGRWCVPYRCPDELLGHVTEEAPSRDVVAVVQEDGAKVTALTRLRPGFALGVVGYGSLWMQGRPVIAYAPGSAGPVAFRPRLTYDGCDLAAARIFTAVRGDTVLAGLGVADDVGAYHPILDKEWTGRFRAGDLRLRLELLGVDRDQLPAALGFGETCRIGFGSSAVLRVRLLDAGFAGWRPQIEVTAVDGGCAIDVVLYRGAERIFALVPSPDTARAQVVACYAALAFQLTEDVTGPDELTEASCRLADGHVELGFGADDRVLRFPTSPRPAAELGVAANGGAGERG